MQGHVLIDGAASDAAWTSERAFQYGDGLFETVAIVNGRPCLWDAHMSRLAEGCRRLRLPQPDVALLCNECLALAAGHSRAVIKIYWTAGDSQRGYGRPEPLRPHRILRLAAWPPAADVGGEPWTLRLCTQRMSENPSLARIKHLNRLDQVLARSEWTNANIDEGLMLGQDGRVLCGTMTNLFIQRGDALITPSLESAGIAGVVRELLLRLGESRHMMVREERVSRKQLEFCDAAYVTNSLIGVVRVGRFDTTRCDMGIAEHALVGEARSLCHSTEIGG